MIIAMPFEEIKLEESFAFDPKRVDELRQLWGDLIQIAVWGNVKSGTIGATPRMRKRILEVGEHLASLLSDRRWIPNDRERVKGAMASSLNLRDALLQMDRTAKLLQSGEDFPEFERLYLEFRKKLLVFMELHEQMWGALLESLYDESDE